jgi:uncharacterized protein (TIGR02118 family)
VILRIGFAPRRPGMSTSQFLQHWRSDHADAAARLPGLQRYVQLHPVLRDNDVHALGHPGFDACSILEFADLDSMDAAFASPEYHRAVATDEARFVDKDRFGMFLGTGSAPPIGVGQPGCWLVTFLRRHPAVPADTLADALRDDVDTGHLVAGRTTWAALDVERPGRGSRCYDAVELLQFDDAGAAGPAVGGPGGGHHPAARATAPGAMITY